ncbi:UNVERIFIED_CONTAM: hypothetical protein HDU68_001484 [Siphonaria sp. JEL0065]|nr:hypothetical protein HDU68_001484 [Siphonaria sp. JEL0065]
MASQLTIELEGSFPTKKTVIKTTPAMPLNDVLKVAIEKLGNQSAPYVLKHGKTQLDLSLSVRFANLPAGAKLILSPSSSVSSTRTPIAPKPVASSSLPANAASASMISASSQQPQAIQPQQPLGLVTIALQVQEGPRIIKKFPLTTSLWSLLKSLERDDPSLNLTSVQQQLPITPPSSSLPKALHAISEASKKLAQSQKPLVYAFPLLILSNKEYGTFKALKETTLEGTGLRGGGNALVRLLWKVDAGVFLEDVKGEVDAEWEGVVVSAVVPVVAKPVVQKPVAASTPRKLGVQEGGDAMDVDHQSLSSKVEDHSVELNHGDFDRGIKVFAAPPADVDGPMNIQLPDTFFQLSSTELKLAYISSKNKAKQLEDAPLMTKAMRDREEELKMKKWPKTMIRVRFPDRVTVQAAFLSTEPVSAIYTLISETLATPTKKYILYTTPPLLNLDSKKEFTFWKAGLAPATIVYFKWEDGNITDSYLNQMYMSKMEELPVPPVDVVSEISFSADAGEDVDMDIGGGSSSGVSVSIPSSREYRNSDSVPERKVPKWFKMGRK